MRVTSEEMGLQFAWGGKPKRGVAVRFEGDADTIVAWLEGLTTRLKQQGLYWSTVAHNVERADPDKVLPSVDVLGWLKLDVVTWKAEFSSWEGAAFTFGLLSLWAGLEDEKAWERVRVEKTAGWGLEW